MKRDGAHDDQPHYTIIFKPTIWRFTGGGGDKQVRHRRKFGAWI